jgi:hypothetical protein
MIAQLNPTDIVLGHLRTLGKKDIKEKDHASVYEVSLFLLFGVPFAALQLIAVNESIFLTGEIVSTVVSAASIIAGLLLNLLVLTYTLVVNHAKDLTDSREIFKKVALHTFYNISFTVFASLILVLVCLMCLANNLTLKILGNVLTFYVGPLVAVSLLMVLKKCHKLIGFYLVQPVS